MLTIKQNLVPSLPMKRSLFFNFLLFGSTPSPMKRSNHYKFQYILTIKHIWFPPSQWKGVSFSFYFYFGSSPSPMKRSNNSHTAILILAFLGYKFFLTIDSLLKSLQILVLLFADFPPPLVELGKLKYEDLVSDH